MEQTINTTTNTTTSLGYVANTSFPCDTNYPTLGDYHVWEIKGFYGGFCEEDILVACHKSLTLEEESSTIEEYEDAIWEYIFNSYFGDEPEVSDADLKLITTETTDIADENTYLELRTLLPVVAIKG